jgi:hypothetical protein
MCSTSRATIVCRVGSAAEKISTEWRVLNSGQQMAASKLSAELAYAR